jgi:hypothetical protein
VRITIFLPLVLAAGLVAQSAQRPIHQRFLVRISEGWSTLRPTSGPNNFSNCLIVTPDARMHLELRREEFFDGRAVLTTYESALQGKELEILRSILDDAGLSTLHPFVGPVVPMDVDDWLVFTADIQRGAQVQRVGYVTWDGHGPNNSEGDKIAWKDAIIALKPLVEWAHAVKSSKSSNWQQVRNPKTTCGESD